MGTVLDPRVFPTIKDKPRQQQYHIESENIDQLYPLALGIRRRRLLLFVMNHNKLKMISLHENKQNVRGHRNVI